MNGRSDILSVTDSRVWFLLSQHTDGILSTQHPLRIIEVHKRASHGVIKCRINVEQNLEKEIISQ